MPPSTTPHDHGGPGAGHRPAEVRTDFGALHLAAAAFAVVIGVLALPVGADRAGVVDVMPQLAHVLDHHGDAVGVGLAQVPAGGVVRPLAAEFYRAVADVVAALAL